MRRALEVPVGSFETEIEWLYHTNGKLTKILRDARALIEKSKKDKDKETPAGDDSERAVPRLSGGGIITVERTLTRLQAISDAHSQSTAEPGPSSSSTS